MKHIKGLKIDTEGGSGCLELPDSFQNEHALFRADVLGDWLRAVKAAYDKAVIEMHAGYAGYSVAAYKKRVAKQNAEVLKESKENLASFAGKTILKAGLSKDGAVQLVFTDGTQHAIYHGSMNAEQPVMASPALTAKEIADNSAAI